MVVSKGDTIFVPADKLGQKEVDVKWSQALKTRERTYVICKYENKTPNDSEREGLIFIQKDKVDELKKKAIGGDQLTLNVDESFQFGQKKGGTERWLCYHDQERKPYQHRFVDSAVTKFGNMAAGMVSSAGYTQVNQVGDALKGAFGDPLRAF